jgi:molybdenum cofactor sulfurtransferase
MLECTETDQRFDTLRRTEFSRLDRRGQVYLDYTGAGLFPESLVDRHAELLRNSVLGNPHSENPTSAHATDLVERCRARVLRFFNASPDEYAVIFTANASQALKLIGESYPFASDGSLLLTVDNHNSVLGIREFARARGSSVRYVPIRAPEMRLDETALATCLARRPVNGHHLFAYPAQSNFSGVQHPLALIPRARALGWEVLLDAAAFVPTNRLDLGCWHPDYVVMSFYKMFGYPTGVGALLVRHEALGRLRRPWFAGGTITVVSVRAERHYLAPGVAAFEDGTSNFLALPAVDLGLQFIDSLGIDAIHERVRSLAAALMEALLNLRHDNGRPLVRLYGPATMEHRGATIALNLLGRDGRTIEPRVVERLSSREGISLRTGCFCNPGAGEVSLGLSKAELEACFLQAPDHLSFDDLHRCTNGKSSGAVRVSFGLASNTADVNAMVDFAARFLEND